MPGPENRRAFLSRVTELFAAAGVGAIGVANARQGHSYVAIDSEMAVSAENRFPEIAVLLHHSKHLQDGLTSLMSVYHHAYEKTMLVPRTTLDAKGNVSVTLEEEKYWKEESNVPSHDVIAAWQNSFNTHVERTEHLTDPSLIDKAKVGQLLVHTKNTSRMFELGGSVVLYGAQLAALLGYEELVGAKEYRERIEGPEAAENEQSRRGFVKLAALAVGVATAGSVRSTLNHNLARGVERSQSAIEKAKEQSNLISGSAFRGYFDATPEALIDEVRSIRERLQRSLDSRVEDQGVREAMKAVVERCQKMESFLGQLFADGVPTGLGDLCAGAIITRTIDDARSKESLRAGAGIFIEGLSVGGAMAATVVGMETLDRCVFAKRGVTELV